MPQFLLFVITTRDLKIHPYFNIPVYNLTMFSKRSNRARKIISECLKVIRVEIKHAFNTNCSSGFVNYIKTRTFTIIFVIAINGMCMYYNLIISFPLVASTFVECDMHFLPYIESRSALCTILNANQAYNNQAYIMSWSLKSCHCSCSGDYAWHNIHFVIYTENLLLQQPILLSLAYYLRNLSALYLLMTFSEKFLSFTVQAKAINVIENWSNSWL